MLPVPALSQSIYGASEEVLTLDKALELAVTANRKLDNAALEVDRAERNVAAARTEFLPALNLEAGASHNFSSQDFRFEPGAFGNFPATGPIPATPTFISTAPGTTSVVSGSITQPLTQLYRIGLVVDQTEVQQSLAEQNLRSRRQDLVKQVKQQYYEILKTQSALAATEESIAFYRELSALVGRYVQEKVALEYQSLETQSRLARVEHKARTERNALKTQKERLNDLLGRNVKTAFSVSAVGSATITDPDPAKAEATALAQRPDVQEARLKLEQAQYGYRIKQSEYIPAVSLAMRYSRLFDVQLIPNEIWTLGVFARWELYDWGRKSEELGKKTAEVMQARNDVAEAESQAVIEVDARIRELEEAGELVKVTALAQAAAREKLRVLTNQYRERTALLKDVLQAESELADANNEHQQAVLSVWTARAHLDQALGED